MCLGYALMWINVIEFDCPRPHPNGLHESVIFVQCCPSYYKDVKLVSTICLIYKATVAQPIQTQFPNKLYTAKRHCGTRQDVQPLHFLGLHCYLAIARTCFKVTDKVLQSKQLGK
jgi:hypothetical protein